MPVSGGAANSALGLGVGRSCCIPHLVKHRPDFLLVALLSQPGFQLVPGDLLGSVLLPLCPGFRFCRYRRKPLEPCPEPVPATAFGFLDALTGEHHRAFAVDYGGELDHAWPSRLRISRSIYHRAFRRSSRASCFRSARQMYFTALPRQKFMCSVT